MKNAKMAIYLMAAVLVMATGNIVSATEFKDGGTHNVDYIINNGDLRVDYFAPGMQTTVNLLEGGSVVQGYGLHAYEDGRINVTGGNAGALCADGRSYVTMSGGTAYVLDAYDNSHVIMNGGLVSDITAE